MSGCREWVVGTSCSTIKRVLLARPDFPQLALMLFLVLSCYWLP
jgi:hypothetical protein